jgi:sugar (glycoside-pentoside-hexuronide) transporter
MPSSHSGPPLLATRLSYATPEIGGQLIFCVISFYLLKFYTDVYGLPVAAAGAILLIARCVDAIDAPVWGIIFDKTRSRWGRSRPWFLWLCVPFAGFGVLTFYTPHLGTAGKIAYAACTYVLCSILYTGINTPVTSILAGLTRSVRERVTLTTFRMFGSKFGVLIVNLTLLRLVAGFGHGNNRRGFFLVMLLYAAGSVVLFLIAFRNLRETVQDDPRRLSVRESVRALRGNGPWLITFVSSLLFWIAFIARISAAPYYFEYLMHRANLVSIANSLDVVSLASILFLPWFCRITSKRNVWVLGLLGSVIGQLIVYAGTGSRSVAIVMAGWTVGFLASGVAMALPFSILATSIDYGEWKTGIRAAGFLTAVGAAFCLKAGSGLGGALPAWIMGHYSYVPNVAQSARSLLGIELSCVWLPAVAYGLAIVPVLFYSRYERHEPAMMQDLDQRRRIAEAIDQI